MRLWNTYKDTKDDLHGTRLADSVSIKRMMEGRKRGEIKLLSSRQLSL